MMIWLCLFMAFACASDLLTREVPISASVLVIAIRLFFLMFGGMGVKRAEYFISAVTMFLLMYLFMNAGRLGGADCLACTAMAFYLGVYAFWAVMIGMTCTLPMLIKWKIQDAEKEYPLIPFLTAGFCAVLLLMNRKGIPFG